MRLDQIVIGPSALERGAPEELHVHRDTGLPKSLLLHRLVFATVFVKTPDGLTPHLRIEARRVRADTVLTNAERQIEADRVLEPAEQRALVVGPIRRNGSSVD